MDKKLQGILAEVFGLRPSEITDKLTRDDVETWDSLKQMDLILSLERAYDLTLEIEDIVSMLSVANIIAVLKDKGVELES